MKTKEITLSNFIHRSRWPTMWGGGFYLAAVAIWHPLSEILFAETSWAVTSPLGHAIHHAPELPAYALLAVGLIELSRRQVHHLGWVGKMGLYLTLIGFVLMSFGTLGIVLFEGVFQTSVDALETVHPLLLLPLIGSILGGLAILKAKVLSSVGAGLIIIAPLMFLGLIFSGLIDTSWGYWVGKGVLTLFSAGWIRLGHAFWLEGRESVRPGKQVRQQPSHLH